MLLGHVFSLVRVIIHRISVIFAQEPPRPVVVRRSLVVPLILTNLFLRSPYRILCAIDQDRGFPQSRRRSQDIARRYVSPISKCDP